MRMMWCGGSGYSRRRLLAKRLVNKELAGAQKERDAMRAFAKRLQKKYRYTAGFSWAAPVADMLDYLAKRHARFTKAPGGLGK